MPTGAWYMTVSFVASLLFLSLGIPLKSKWLVYLALWCFGTFFVFLIIGMVSDFI